MYLTSVVFWTAVFLAVPLVIVISPTLIPVRFHLVDAVIYVSAILVGVAWFILLIGELVGDIRSRLQNKYTLMGNEITGPLTVDELKSLIDSQTISPDCLCYFGGSPRGTSFCAFHKPVSTVLETDFPKMADRHA